MTPRAADAVIARRESAGAVTVADARRALAQKFRAAGLDSPELDARILVGHALWTRSCRARCGRRPRA